MAGEVAEWAVPLVRAELHKATDENREIGTDQLQAEVGLGADDLRGVLDHLREYGEAVEDSPGMWRRPYEDEGGRTTLAESREQFSAGNEHMREVADRIAERAPDDAGPVETVLTAGMVKQLDAEAVGKLVLAGLESSEGRAFVLRIEP